MKKLIVILLSILSLQGFSQETKSSFTFCGKTGNITMTWEEFLKCKKELVPSEPNTVISTFTLSVKVNEMYENYSCAQGDFTRAAAAIEKHRNDSTFDGKVLIEEVKVKGANSTEEKKVPGIIITLK